jgi:polyisoprenoid-binding protein YceI
MKPLGLLILVAASAQAQAVYDLDAPQSRAAFTLGGVLHSVHGTFKVKHGSIQFESSQSKSSGTASGEITIDATSGASGNGARDRHMHQSILESKQYPEISFVPSRVRGVVNSTGESKIEIDGTFTIHGAAHPLTATAVVNAEGDRLEASVHFTVPYVAWGLKNPSTLFLKVNESVEVEFDATGHITWPH